MKDFKLSSAVKNEKFNITKLLVNYAVPKSAKLLRN